MRPQVVPVLALLCLGLFGCAGRTPDETSSVNLNLSGPISSNVNLAPLDDATGFQRASTSPLNVQVTESPGPIGVSSRIAVLNITTPVTGTEYALVSGDSTYIQFTQTDGFGTSVWRSSGGKLTLSQNDSKASIFTLTNVEMTAFSGTATGNFVINGTVQIRF